MDGTPPLLRPHHRWERPTTPPHQSPPPSLMGGAMGKAAMGNDGYARLPWMMGWVRRSWTLGAMDGLVPGYAHAGLDA